MAETLNNITGVGIMVHYLCSTRHNADASVHFAEAFPFKGYLYTGLVLVMGLSRRIKRLH